MNKMIENDLTTKLNIENKILRVEGLLPTKNNDGMLIDANIYWAEKGIENLKSLEKREKYFKKLDKLKREYYSN